MFNGDEIDGGNTNRSELAKTVVMGAKKTVLGAQWG